MLVLLFHPVMKPPANPALFPKLRVHCPFYIGAPIHPRVILCSHPRPPREAGGAISIPKMPIYPGALAPPVLGAARREVRKASRRRWASDQEGEKGAWAERDFGGWWRTVL